jgi:hypothetical protein
MEYALTYAAALAARFYAYAPAVTFTNVLLGI